MRPAARAQLPRLLVAVYAGVATAAFVWVYFIAGIREMGLYLSVMAIGFPSSLLLVDSELVTLPWSIGGAHPILIHLVCTAANATLLWLVVRLLVPRASRRSPALNGDV